MTEMLVIYLGALRASILEKHNESLFFFSPQVNAVHMLSLDPLNMVFMWK